MLCFIFFRTPLKCVPGWEFFLTSRKEGSYLRNLYQNVYSVMVNYEKLHFSSNFLQENKQKLQCFQFSKKKSKQTTQHGNTFIHKSRDFSFSN